MSSTSYRKKRDFAQTLEPQGKTIPTKKGEELFFVVQGHWATHYHFDFRLQMEGVLKSWVLPKGLPGKLGEKRLAVQVEDHPLEYATFKGEIPQGQYGGGTVEVWDHGKLKIYEKTANLIRFELLGQKAKGRFTLFKPPQFEKKNWLLIKNN